LLYVVGVFGGKYVKERAFSCPLFLASEVVVTTCLTIDGKNFDVKMKN